MNRSAFTLDAISPLSGETAPIVDVRSCEIALGDGAALAEAAARYVAALADCGRAKLAERERERDAARAAAIARALAADAKRGAALADARRGDLARVDAATAPPSESVGAWRLRGAGKSHELTARLVAAWHLGGDRRVDLPRRGRAYALPLDAAPSLQLCVADAGAARAMLAAAAPNVSARSLSRVIGEARAVARAAIAAASARAAVAEAHSAAADAIGGGDLARLDAAILSGAVALPPRAATRRERRLARSARVAERRALAAAARAADLLAERSSAAALSSALAAEAALASPIGARADKRRARATVARDVADATRRGEVAAALAEVESARAFAYRVAAYRETRAYAKARAALDAARAEVAAEIAAAETERALSHMLARGRRKRAPVGDHLARRVDLALGRRAAEIATRARALVDARAAAARAEVDALAETERRAAEIAAAIGGAEALAAFKSASAARALAADAIAVADALDFADAIAAEAARVETVAAEALAAVAAVDDSADVAAAFTRSRVARAKRALERIKARRERDALAASRQVADAPAVDVAALSRALAAPSGALVAADDLAAIGGAAALAAARRDARRRIRSAILARSRARAAEIAAARDPMQAASIHYHLIPRSRREQVAATVAPNAIGAAAVSRKANPAPISAR